MRSNARRAGETVDEGVPVDPTELVPVSALASEGFGWGGQFVTMPRDAVDALARELGDHVILDDIGRRCVTRATARGLFTERAAAEAKQREAQARREAELDELAASNRPRTGVPADRIPDGVSPAAWMLQTAKDAEPHRESVLEHALRNGGEVVYYPLREDES